MFQTSGKARAFLVFQPFLGGYVLLSHHDIDLFFHVMTLPDFIHSLLVLKRSECLITVAANTAQGEMAQKLDGLKIMGKSTLSAGYLLYVQ